MDSEMLLVELVGPEKDFTDYLSIVASFLGPIVTALIGFWVYKLTKRIEHSQWRNQKLIEKRISILDIVNPTLNDIFCYSVRVGKWKNLTPTELVEWKRKVDKEIHINRPYFSSAFFDCYMAFLNTCYSTYQGHGVDAKLRTNLKYHKSSHGCWDDLWDDCFSENISSERDIIAAYKRFQNQVSVELNVE